MVEFLKIGKIINTMGVRGEIKVMPLTDDIERFEDLEWVYLNNRGNRTKVNIENVRYNKSFVLLKLEGIDDMNAAERLKENFLEVDREHAIELSKDQFFICDLIGLEVYTETGELLGKLTEVMPTGNNDVYVVKSEKEEILIPALKKVVKKVDIKEKKMVVELMKGLRDEV